jgi:hypothetical protein
MENAHNTSPLNEQTILDDADLVQSILDAPSSKPLTSEEFLEWLYSL